MILDGVLNTLNVHVSTGVPYTHTSKEASFLYDMYLDDEDLEAFMASMDVKGAFPNTPHGLIEEVWRQLGLPYGDFVGEWNRVRPLSPYMPPTYGVRQLGPATAAAAARITLPVRFVACSSALSAGAQSCRRWSAGPLVGSFPLCQAPIPCLGSPFLQPTVWPHPSPARCPPAPHRTLVQPRS